MYRHSKEEEDMESFLAVFSQVVISLIFIIPGFVLTKVRKTTADHLPTLSAILIYIFSPCMIWSSFMQLTFTWETFGYMMLFFGVTFVLQCVFMGVLYILFRKKYDDARYRVLTIGSVLGNVGFMGLPVVQAFFPNDAIVMCYSSVYVISMNLLVFTMGIFCLTNNRKYMSIKSAILNPTTISFLIALPLYFFGVGDILNSNVYTAKLYDAIVLLGKATTPVCMIILGIRLASVSFKKLFMRPSIYAICGLKLIVFPLFCYLCVVFLPLPVSFKGSILILSSVPSASVILNMAEMYHGETELAANCILVTTLLCFITIPVLTLLI
jgi:predicted permease